MQELKLKWTPEIALNCLEEKVFFTNIYSKSHFIRINKYNTCWLRNPSFTFLDVIEDNNGIIKTLRVADTEEMIRKFLLELNYTENQTEEMIKKYGVNSFNSGYIHFCPKNYDFTISDMEKFSQCEKFKSLNLELRGTQLNKKIFVNTSFITCIEDVIELGNTLNQAISVTKPGSYMSDTPLNKRVMNRLNSTLKNKVLECISKDLLLDVSNFSDKDKAVKIELLQPITLEEAINKKMIYSKLFGLASDSKNSFQLAFQKSYTQIKRNDKYFREEFEKVNLEYDKLNKVAIEKIETPLKSPLIWNYGMEEKIEIGKFSSGDKNVEKKSETISFSNDKKINNNPLLEDKDESMNFSEDKKERKNKQVNNSLLEDKDDNINIYNNKKERKIKQINNSLLDEKKQRKIKQANNPLLEDKKEIIMKRRGRAKTTKNINNNNENISEDIDETYKKNKIVKTTTIPKNKNEIVLSNKRPKKIINNRKKPEMIE